MIRKTVSSFEQGKFTQVLSGIRLSDQEANQGKNADVLMTLDQYIDDLRSRSNTARQDALIEIENEGITTNLTPDDIDIDFVGDFGPNPGGGI